MNKPISPVIVTFKELPGVRLQPIPEPPKFACTKCRLQFMSAACYQGSVAPKGGCAVRGYIWREVPPKEQP